MVQNDFMKHHMIVWLMHKKCYSLYNSRFSVCPWVSCDILIAGGFIKVVDCLMLWHGCTSLTLLL